MTDGKKAQWLELVGLLAAIGSIGAIYSLFSGGDVVKGFFGSLRGFAIAILVLAAHVAPPAAIGYLLGKGKSEKQQYALVGAGIGWFIFLFFAHIWF